MNWHLEVASELVVTDHNPEMADIDNPRGAIFADSFFVIAIDDEGRVYAHKNATLDRQEAERWLESIKRRFNPLTFDAGNSPHWKYYRNQYGSEEYLMNAVEDAYREKEDALADEAFGPFYP